jgi:hypothetical protein
MQGMTIETAKRAAKGLVGPVNSVLLATAHAQLTREKVDPITRSVLADLGVKDEDGNPIVEPAKYWLMADGFAAAYYAEREKRLIAAGFEIDEPGKCPALVAEEIQRIAERELVRAAEEYFPEITLDKILVCSGGVDKLGDYVKLLCRLVTSERGYKNPLAKYVRKAAG